MLLLNLTHTFNLLFPFPPHPIRVSSSKTLHPYLFSFPFCPFPCLLLSFFSILFPVFVIFLFTITSKEHLAFITTYATLILSLFSPPHYTTIYIHLILNFTYFSSPAFLLLTIPLQSFPGYTVPLSVIISKRSVLYPRIFS